MSCLTAEVQEAARAATGTILDQFAADPKRQDRMSLSVGAIYLDVAKQSWDRATFEALIHMAEQSPLSDARAKMWSGGAINQSENRAVLHVALRATDAENAVARGQALADEVAEGRAAMKAFADGVRSGAIRGSTGKPFSALVHIGIGGSDLGPRVLWDALRPARPDFDLRFVANVDGAELSLALAGLDPETTLVIGVSKTFGTQETLANLIKARDWLVNHLGEDAAGQHLAAVSAAPEKAAAYGIVADRVFSFRDWVGGRYSLWSAVSLSIAVALGYDVFQRLLDGAREMDQHFLLAPMDQNAPVLLALAQYHNRVLRDRPTRAVIPYVHRLRRLAAFLQQLEMESNGKSVSPDGQQVALPTCPVVFGDEGTNTQHAFFQMLHQGRDVVPVEFIAAVHNPEASADMQQKLLANMIAQSEAFMTGKSLETAQAELVAQGLSADTIAILAPQKVCPGNKPSTVLLLDALTPESLGALLALYEHKTFVEGILYGINSFDQWGVELGKTLANEVLRALEGQNLKAYDPSSAALITRCRAV